MVKGVKLNMHCNAYLYTFQSMRSNLHHILEVFSSLLRSFSTTRCGLTQFAVLAKMHNFHIMSPLSKLLDFRKNHDAFFLSFSTLKCVMTSKKLNKNLKLKKRKNNRFCRYLNYGILQHKWLVTQT